MDPTSHAPAHNHHHLRLGHSWISLLLKARQRHCHPAPLTSVPFSRYSDHCGPPPLTRSRTDSSPATATKSSTPPSSSSMGLQHHLDDPEACSSRHLLKYRQREWWSCNAQPGKLPALIPQSCHPTIHQFPRSREPPRSPRISSSDIPKWIEYPVSARLFAESSETDHCTSLESGRPDSPTHLSSPPLAWGGMITTDVLDDCSDGTRIADPGNREWPNDEERDPPASRSHGPNTGQ